jgi:hypothetical protein
MEIPSSRQVLGAPEEKEVVENATVQMLAKKRYRRGPSKING